MDNKELEVEDEKLSEAEEHKTNIFQRMWRGLKSALMGTLFVMAKDSRVSFKMNLLGMLIDTLQILSFPFNDRAEFPWNKEYSELFAEICYYIKFEFYISEENALQNLIIYLCCMFFVFANLLNFGIVGYRFINKKVQNVVLLKTLRSVSSLMTTLLYLPFQTLFIIILSCAVGAMDFEGCPKEQSWLLIASSTIISIIFGLLSLIVAASFYELEYTSEDVAARPHARVELLFLVTKAAIIFFFNFYYEKEYYWMLDIILLVSGITITYLYLYYMPFYDYRTCVIQTRFLAIFTWAGICLAIALIIDNHEDPAPVTMFYIGIPCWWILIGEACNWRRRVLLNKTINTIRNPYEVELHTRFMILDRVGSYKTKDTQLLDEIEEFYYQAERKFPKSSILKIFVAQFHLTYKNRQEAIPKLEQAEERSPKLDEQFIIYKTRQHVGKDAITMVTFASYLESAHIAEVQSLSAQTEFWRELGKNKAPSFDNLTRLAKTITKNFDTAYSHYQYLMNVDRTNKKMLPMYVYFLQDLMHRDDLEVRNLRNRVHDIRAQDSVKVVSKDIFLINPEVEITCSGHAIGLIEKVNSSFLLWLQYPKALLINQNIIRFMPDPFGRDFLARIDAFQDYWEDLNEISPDDVYFIDKDGYIVSAPCKLIIANDDLINRRKSMVTKDLLKDDDTTNNSNLLQDDSKLGNTADAIAYYQRPMFPDLANKLACQFSISDDDVALLIINSDMKIIYFNRQAHFYFGVIPDLHGHKDISEIIANFKMIFERSKIKIKTRTGRHLDYEPVQSFVLTPNGRYLKVVFNISEHCIEKNVFYIINMTEAPPYSKSTNLFLAHFSRVIESALMRRNTRIESAVVNPESTENGLKSTKKILMSLRKQIEEKNRGFSPELNRLNLYFLLFGVFMIVVFSVNFYIVEVSFDTYTDRLDYMSSLTDIQNYSVLLSFFVRLLDANQRGLKMPEDTNSIITQASYAALNLSNLASDMSNHVSFTWLQNSEINCLSYDTAKGYYIDNFNPINSIMQQVTFTKKLIKSDLNDWDVETNPTSYWVFENGMTSIATALDYLADKYNDKAYDDRENTLLFGVWFALAEVMLVFILLLFVLPLFFKSERIHLEVVGVFFSINQKLVSYLEEDTINKLSMRKDKSYPDCRSQYRAGEELWNEIVFSDIKKAELGSFTDKRHKLIAHNKRCISRLKLIFTNGLMRSIWLFCIISLIYVLVFQLWVGELIPLNLLEHGVRIVKYFGTMDILLTRSNLFLINIVMSTMQGYDNITELNGTYPNAYLSIDYASKEFLNETDNLRNFMEALLVGNNTMNMPYKDIYSLSRSDFYNDLFVDSCESLVSGLDCSALDDILNSGYRESIMTFIFDSEFLAKKTYIDMIDSTIEERWEALDYDLLRTLQLEYKFLWLMGKGVQNNVLDYFHNTLDAYYLVRQWVLIFFCITTFFYYILIFRKALARQERRRKLSRSMLLLLPEKIVVRSQEVQDYLCHINLD
ncbi:unnamed protein product [Blepharisma stoltei]|uniref:TmcB/TmcC TPR repeats domain-containing protein n=1 Tax=Blepharisma stoltei TaxID=1481888 RepID=A0AAU9JKF5_9CILI|nr:unnamed protein product [Blepharisma stoltei]